MMRAEASTHACANSVPEHSSRWYARPSAGRDVHKLRQFVSAQGMRAGLGARGPGHPCAVPCSDGRHAARSPAAIRGARRALGGDRTRAGAGRGMTRSCAMFDLRNFAAALTGREDCIAVDCDPLTFENEIQIALDPFLFRRCTYGSRLIGPTLCARTAAGDGECDAPLPVVPRP